MGRLWLVAATLVPLALSAPLPATGQAPGTQPAPPPSPTLPAAKASSQAVLVPETGGVRIGTVEVDPRAREVRFAAEVNMNEGLLEYAVVGDQGKLHESLLRTAVEPYDLQVALLLLGLKGGEGPQFQGDPQAPRGDPVAIWVEWQADGAAKRVPLESLVRNETVHEPMGPGYWVFTGSRIVDGVFLAQAERSVVAIFRDPVSMIDSSHPEAADDTVWFANAELTPAPGTPVTVTIRPAAR